MDCAFDSVAFDSVAFDVCSSVQRVYGGFLFPPNVVQRLPDVIDEEELIAWFMLEEM